MERGTLKIRYSPTTPIGKAPLFCHPGTLSRSRGSRVLGSFTSTQNVFLKSNNICCCLCVLLPFVNVLIFRKKGSKKMWHRTFTSVGLFFDYFCKLMPVSFCTLIKTFRVRHIQHHGRISVRACLSILLGMLPISENDSKFPNTVCTMPFIDLLMLTKKNSVVYYQYCMKVCDGCVFFLSSTEYFQIFHCLLFFFGFFSYLDIQTGCLGSN